MNPLDGMLKEAEEARATTPEADKACPLYSTRTWTELAEMELTPPRPVWGGIVLGGVGVIFGQGGLGKSRGALNLARNQVLGLPFAGLPTGADPLRHLLMGSENSIHRLQNDARRMCAGLDESQVRRLGENIRMATLEHPDDAFISVADEDNLAKWKATLEAWPPDVLWVDPWGDVLAGEANSDEDARGTITVLRGLLRRANPDAALVILAHSRTGARNIAQAAGYDAANFGKGSKALYSAARCVWNLAPGDESDTPTLVFCNAKSNDGPRIPSFSVRLDPETMTYDRAADFDFEAWLSEVNDRANGKIKGRRRPQLTEDEAFEALGDHTLSALEIRTLLRDKGATRDEADSLCTSLVMSGRWERWRPHLKTAHTFYGPPSAMIRRRGLIA